MVGRHLILVVCALLPAVFAALPKGWKACSRKAPDYEKCLIKEATGAINSLMSGDKKFGLYPLDPLRIEHLTIPKGQGPVNIDLTFKKLDLSGIKNYKIISAKNDWKNLETKIFIPQLYVLGDYEVDGKVLVLPITGKGKANLTFDQLNLDIKITFKEIEKGGKKYYSMEKFITNITPKRLYLKLTNLFNGDKALGDNMNVFINENWEDILKELKPGIQSALSQALTIIANKVLSKIPAEEINIP